jgi:putative phosphoesterase
MAVDDKVEKIERVIGVISDTHGLLRPEAVEALRGVDLILHAGDVGSSEVLETLKGIAPVVAVRGNNDRGHWADDLPQWEVAEVGSISIYMIHDVKEIDLDPAAAGFQVVVSGHSHKPSVEERKGVLYVNPGSVGPRRFSLPVTIARLKVCGEAVIAEVVELFQTQPLTKES